MSPEEVYFRYRLTMSAHKVYEFGREIVRLADFEMMQDLKRQAECVPVKRVVGKVEMEPEADGVLL